jgi:hypothetical protein
LISAIQAGTPGLSRIDAVAYAQVYVGSGAAMPVATNIRAGTELIKLVPAGGKSPGSYGYYLTVSEFNALRADPAALTSRLGLPLGSHSAAYDVYRVTARTRTTVFTSIVAPTAQGTLRQSGGATQTIIGNGSAFTRPRSIGRIP